MASGNFSTNKSNNLNLYVEWSSTSNVNTNSSEVTVNLYVKSYSLQGSALSGSYLTVNGSQTNWTYSFNISNNSSITTTKVATKTVTVQHNSDGTKSIPIKANFKFNGTYGGVYVGDLSISKTVKLDNIPRASSLSVPSNVNVLSNLNVNISPSNSTYRHKVRFTVDGEIKYTSGYIAAGTNSFSYRVPRSWVTGISDKKVTVTLYTYTSSGTSNIGSKSTTTTIKVPCSSFSVPSSTATGSSFKITITPYGSGYRHRFKFIVNGTDKFTSGFVAAGTNSYSYTIPHDWLTTSETTTMTVYCYTYNSSYNDDYTARVKKTVTLNVPNTTKPSITSLTPTIIDGLSGKYVQGKSKVKLTVDAQTSGGSAISSYIYQGANINGESSSYTGTSASKTSSIINATGTQTYSAQVKDQRGRYSDIEETSIVVYEYSAPKIVSITAQRCQSNGTLDSNGTYAKVTVQVSYASIGGANKRTVILSNSKDNFATNTTVLSPNTTGTTYTGVYGSGFAVNSNYTIKAVIKDTYNTGNNISKSTTLKVAERTINIAKYGNGVSIGGLSTITSSASDGLFEVNWPTTISNNLSVANGITTGSSIGNTNAYNLGNFAIYCKWADTANHDILVRSSDGLSVGLGWVGSSTYETSLDIRPRSVRIRGNTTFDKNVYIKNDQSYRAYMSNGTTDLNLIKLTDGDNLVIGAAGANGSRVKDIYIYSHSDDSSKETMKIGSDTNGRYIQSLPTYNRTYGGAANLYITSNGTFGRSTSSSERYKKDIEDVNSDELNPYKILSIPVKQYRYNEDNIPTDRNPEDLYIGLIAEDVAREYPVAAEYTENGQVEMWNIKMLFPALLKIVQDQQKTIELLTSEMQALKADINNMNK